ncbi:MAG: hypothetical protein QOG00_272 [Pyrinomonadaceae bacterium]|nr:hypothetical protein [Pyrinomonadaceae bacterium]
MELTRKQIIEQARAYTGVRFRHQSEDPGAGLDCRGHLVAVCRALGVTLTQNSRVYKHKPDGADFLRRMRAEAALVEIDVSARADGDLVMLAFPGDEFPVHVGFVGRGLYEEMIVHATKARRAVVEEPLRMFVEELGARVTHAFGLTARGGF